MTMLKRSLARALATILLLAIPLGVVALESFVGKCVSVSDGDTIGVLRDGKEVKIRLDGIDCPEAGQDFSNKAKRFTSDFAFDKEVRVAVNETDKYGRLVARVTIDRKDISLELVKAGLAWHYKQYSSDTALANAELTARSNETGIWALNNPVAPWEYRHSTTSTNLAKPKATPANEESVTVFITRTGAKYHRAGCQYLRKSAIPISKSDAISRGYSPCSRCSP